jgi:hypothetical protein
MRNERMKLDISITILITAPIKLALQHVADDNMISVSDVVRAAINAAVPVQFEKYTTYLAEATERVEKNNYMKKMLGGEQS